MKNSQRHLKIYSAVLFLALICASVLRTLALFYSFDFASGYFEDKLLISIATAVVVAMAVFALSYIPLAKKTRLVASFDNMATYIPSGLVAVALLTISAHLFISSGAGIRSTPTKILAILAMISVAHFLYNTLSVKKENMTRAYFSLVTISFLAGYVAYLYFDGSMPLNSPNRVVDIMAYLFAALFFLYEARISLGRDCWRAYIAFGLTAAMLMGYSSVPAIILYFARGALISNSIAEVALSFTLFIFIVARLLLISELGDDESSDIVKMVGSMTEERKAKIDESFASRAYSNIKVENDSEDAEYENYTFDFTEESDDGEKESDGV